MNCEEFSSMIDERLEGALWRRSRRFWSTRRNARPAAHSSSWPGK